MAAFEKDPHQRKLDAKLSQLCPGLDLHAGGRAFESDNLTAPSSCLKARCDRAHMERQPTCMLC